MYIIDPSLIASFVSTTKKIPALDLPHKSISCLKDVIDAITAVYENGVPFQTAGQKYKEGVGNYRLVLNTISTMIYDYFNKEATTPNTQSNFDIFHNNLCTTFLNSINAQRAALGVPSLTYGNAQKLINVSFKYLSCFNDYSRFADLFSFCHMAIDSYVLDYFAKNTSLSGCIAHPYPKYRGASWTRLSKADYQALVAGYRSVLSPVYPYFSMLHLEYYIWDAVKSKKTGPIAPIPSSFASTIPQFFM